MYRSYSRIVFFLPAVLFAISPASGCASRTTDNAAASGGSAGATPAANNSLVYSEGWDRIEIVANFAKTKISGSAHFITTRNACGKDADGALEMSLWNTLATDMNAAMKATPLSSPVCKERPEHSKMDGTAEVALSNGKKRMIFEDKGGYEYCTDIQDAALAERLFSEISLLVLMADKEECPNGWGSS